jgi:hypothetical protein
MQLSPILEAAYEILKPAGLKGLHVDAIADQAIERNKNMGLDKEAFALKVSAALAANLKLKSTKPTFARIDGKKKGQYRKGWYRVKQVKVPMPVVPVNPQTNKAFLGKAGELAVMSELLFWQFNVSAMLVDSGIDLVANKGGKYFHIQVKTSSGNAGRYLFTIRQSSFQQNNDSSMFYIFVLREATNCEYLVMPSSYIQALIGSGKITNGATLTVSINVDVSRKKYTLNNREDVNQFLNDFTRIV